MPSGNRVDDARRYLGGSPFITVVDDQNRPACFLQEMRKERSGNTLSDDDEICFIQKWLNWFNFPIESIDPIDWIG